MCDYSLQNVKTRPAKVGDKLTLGAPVCGRGAKILSTTKRRSSVRSIQTAPTPIMMRWNFLMVRSCC